MHMDIPAPTAAARSEAERFVEDLLLANQWDTARAAREIVALAYTGHDNPLKKVFCITVQTITPTGAPSPVSDRQKPLLLSLGFRRRPKQRTETLGSPTAGGEWHPATTPIDSQVDTPGHARGGSAVQYNCIFCSTDLSSRGTCKRHLEDAHVAPTYYRCQRCPGHKFRTKPEAKKHCMQCSGGLFGWVERKPRPKTLYSSEWTPRVFRTQQHYVEHLLELSALPRIARPHQSWHLKLRNLLEQPQLQSALHEMSLKVWGDGETWREARWEYARVDRAVFDLEHGILDLELNTYDLLRIHRAHAFVDDLFNDRLAGPEVVQVSKSGTTGARGFIPRTKGSSDTPHAHESSSLSETTTGHNKDSGVAGTSAIGGPLPGLDFGGADWQSYTTLSVEPTVRAKRPLSYATLPDRTPPEPFLNTVSGGSFAALPDFSLFDYQDLTLSMPPMSVGSSERLESLACAPSYVDSINSTPRPFEQQDRVRYSPNVWTQQINQGEPKLSLDFDVSSKDQSWC